jgi:hypothetical protein
MCASKIKKMDLTIEEYLKAVGIDMNSKKR